MRATGSDARRGGHGDPGTEAIPRVLASPRPRVSVLVAAAALSGLAALINACGYTLVGRSSTLPPSIKIIRFQTLTNQTQRVGVEQRLSREIARELVVTHGTVKLHTKHVYRKLSVNNRRAAVTLARELGLLAAT